MDGKCIADIPGCDWGDAEAHRGMNYAKQDEILTRHLRWHQIMETRRMATALEDFARAQGRLQTAVVAGNPVYAAPPAPSRDLSAVGPRCPECGFGLSSQLHLDRCGIEERVS